MNICFNTHGQNDTLMQANMFVGTSLNPIEVPPHVPQ